MATFDSGSGLLALASYASHLVRIFSGKKLVLILFQVSVFRIQNLVISHVLTEAISNNVEDGMVRIRGLAWAPVGSRLVIMSFHSANPIANIFFSPCVDCFAQLFSIPIEISDHSMDGSRILSKLEHYQGLMITMHKDVMHELQKINDRLSTMEKQIMDNSQQRNK